MFVWPVPFPELFLVPFSLCIGLAPVPTVRTLTRLEAEVCLLLTLVPCKGRSLKREFVSLLQNLCVWLMWCLVSLVLSLFLFPFFCASLSLFYQVHTSLLALASPALFLQGWLLWIQGLLFLHTSTAPTYPPPPTCPIHTCHQPPLLL